MIYPTLTPVHPDGTAKTGRHITPAYGDSDAAPHISGTMQRVDRQEACVTGREVRAATEWRLAIADRGYRASLCVAGSQSRVVCGTMRHGIGQ